MLFSLALLIPLASAMPACTKRSCNDDTVTPSGSITPSLTHIYGVREGNVYCTEGCGEVFKADWNNGGDNTTLTTFYYTDDMAGKTCQFGFELEAASEVTGSGLVDVFSTFHAIEECPTYWWNPNNGRNQHLGRMEVVKGGEATWVAQYLPLANPTPCKAPGTEENLELVGVYDNDHIVWDLDTTGARIYYW